MPLFSGRWRQATAALLCAAGTAGLFGLTGAVGESRLLQTAAAVSAGLQRPETGLRVLADSLTATAPTTTQTAPPPVTTTAATTVATTATTATQVIPTAAVPQNKGDGGRIREMTMTAGHEFVNGVAIRNKSHVDVSLKKEATAPLEFVLSDKEGPKVLIVHTHTTESYMLYDAGFYNEGDAGWTLDESRNVCAVGEAVKAELESRGIGVIHDTTPHDYPRYSGAYTRSAETVKKNLKRYPTVQVVLDLHRDCIMNNETDKIKPTVTAEGEKAAQMMMVMGVGNTVTSPHPHRWENLHLAMAVQRTLHTAYPGVVRPISLANSRYNQDLSTGYMLIEMGSDANTLAEAVHSGHLLGKALGEVMLNTVKKEGTTAEATE